MHDPWTDYSFKVTRHDDPAPANPSINVVLLLGPCALTYSIAHQFSRSFGYLHLDVLARLHRLERTRNVAHTGLLHPLALKECVAQDELPSGRLCVPVVRHMIDEEVERGPRQFVISGVEGSPTVIAAFMSEIAVPNALVFFYRDGDLFDSARGSIKEHFGTRAVMLPFTENVEETYVSLLDLFGRRAGAAMGFVKPRVAPVEIMDIKMEYHEEQDPALTRIDSPVNMLAAANATLRRK